MQPEIFRCERCGTDVVSSVAEGLCPRCLMALVVTAERDQRSPGDRVGPYEIVSLISRGGMGEVYRATDTRLHRTVALKFLSPDVVDSVARRQRFEREARAVSSLNHPHICSLYDIGEQDDTPFLVMEYVEGETLAERLARDTLPIDELLRHAIEIADALDHAHSHGIVHRDLKPANVMLTRTGAKLLDFGVARLGSQGSSGDTWRETMTGVQAITEAGTVIGTLQYMAPEQLGGGSTDRRTDIFAFGAVLYEMATGKPAFAGPDRTSVMAAILDRHPRPCAAIRRDVPEALDQSIRRCLIKDPDGRWQTAGELKRALAEAAEAERRFPAQRLTRGAVAALVAVTAVTAVALALVASRRAETHVRPSRFIVPPPENANFSQSSAFMAVSPDGTALAFVAARDGTNAIWVRALDALQARPLAGTEGGSQPFWSPDSRSLAFGVFGAGIDAMKRIEITGGIPETIAGSRAAPGAWNEDGVILFARGRDRGGALYRISTRGGAAEAVTSLDPARAETNHIWPQFLPDGRRFIFLARSADPQHDGVTYAASLDSPDRVRLVKADSHVVYAPPGYLVFLQVNTLVAQPFDPATLRVTGEPSVLAEQVQRTPGTLRGAFSVSENGVLAYRPIEQTRLAWHDRAGRPLQSIGPPDAYSNPALSMDGLKLAVGRLNFAAGSSGLWTFDLGRGDLATRLTSHTEPEDMPLWRPDGSGLVFKSTSGLRHRTATGHSEVLLTKIASPLAWLPDGRSLLYHARSEQTGFDVWVLPGVGDRTPVPVLQSQFQEGYARPSPNGRWMAYVSDQSGKPEVYVCAFPGCAETRQISNQGGLEPMWSGDGREIFYLAPDRNLMSVPVKSGTTFESGPAVRLFETRMSVVFNPTYTRNQYLPSADGQRFLINQPSAEGPSSPITVVLHWPAVLRR